MSKNTCFTEHLRVATSVVNMLIRDDKYFRVNMYNLSLPIKLTLPQCINPKVRLENQIIEL